MTALAHNFLLTWLEPIRQTNEIRCEILSPAISVRGRASLAAFEETTLSVEAANQLRAILDNPNYPTRQGHALERADESVLLRR